MNKSHKGKPKLYKKFVRFKNQKIKKKKKKKTEKKIIYLFLKKIKWRRRRKEKQRNGQGRVSPTRPTNKTQQHKKKDKIYE